MHHCKNPIPFHRARAVQPVPTSQTENMRQKSLSVSSEYNLLCNLNSEPV